MTSKLCGYVGDRDGVLISYLYGDIDPADRASFAAHLLTCEQCRSELDELRTVRDHLGRWVPPQPQFNARESTVESRRGWREIPVWAQVAAAMLILGVSAGISNLTVTYDGRGLTVRTGWSRVDAQQASVNDAAIARPASGAAPWRADLTALEQRLRADLQPGDALGPKYASVRPPASDAEVLRRVRALLDESERRQERELALRIGQALRDVSAQRTADLDRIQRSVGFIQNTTGIELLKQRQQIDYIVRTSQRQ